MTAPPADTEKEDEVVGPVELDTGIQRRHHNNDDEDDNVIGERLCAREWEDEVYRRTAGWHGQDLIHSKTTSPVHVPNYWVKCTIHSFGNVSCTSQMYIIAYK
jgi:hypothetical protein